MPTIHFTITVDTIAKTVLFKDDNTLWDNSPTSLNIYGKGEDKTVNIIDISITDLVDINLFLYTGLSFTYTELFGISEPLDNFYLIELTADSGTINSDKIAIGFTYQIAKLIYNSVIGVHIPIDDLFTSLTVGAMPQVLEYLKVLSTTANYSFDRENKWRKAFNYLSTIVNGLDY